jgi:nicotinate-nucleotide adenylyltransferase
LIMKIGLFFGSFNPIHIGHMVIANIMAENTDLDEVWFVVTPQNPFKVNKNLLHEFDRYEMVRLAVHDNFKIKVSDIEFNLPKPSYTIDTLVRLQEMHPSEEFVLIIGEDNLEQFPKWKNAEQILKYFTLYVYPRPGCVKTNMHDHAKVKFVEAPLLDVSATYIRNTIRQGKSVKYLIPEQVENYINSKNLFQ